MPIGKRSARFLFCRADRSVCFCELNGNLASFSFLQATMKKRLGTRGARKSVRRFVGLRPFPFTEKRDKATWEARSARTVDTRIVAQFKQNSQSNRRILFKLDLQQIRQDTFINNCSHYDLYILDSCMYNESQLRKRTEGNQRLGSDDRLFELFHVMAGKALRFDPRGGANLRALSFSGFVPFEATRAGRSSEHLLPDGTASAR